MIGAVVGQLVDDAGIAVEGEDHRQVAAEQGVEIALAQPVRMLGLRL